MGRSQVLYNQRHGKQRGGRSGQRAAGRQISGGNRSVSLSKTQVCLVEDNSRRFDPTTTAVDVALEKESLLSSLTQAYDNFQSGAGEYGSSHEAAINLLDDDDLIFSLPSLHIDTTMHDGPIHQKPPFHIDGMAMAKLFADLPASVRLDIPDEMGKHLDGAAVVFGSSINNKRTLAEQKIHFVRELHERIYEEEQKSESLAPPNLISTDTKLKTSCIEVKGSREGTCGSNTRNDDDNDDEEDLDAWLDEVIS